MSEHTPCSANAIYPQLPHVNVDTVVAVNLHGVLANPLRIAQRLRETGLDHSGEAAKLRPSLPYNARAIQYLGRLGGRGMTRAWASDFIVNSPGTQPLLYDDGSRLLTDMRRNHIPHTLLVTEDDSAWPFAFAAAAAYESGTSVYTESGTSNLRGKHVQKWLSPDDTYDMLGLNNDGEPAVVFHGNSVQVIHGRGQAFYGMPPNGEGILLLRNPDTKEKEIERIHDEVTEQVSILDGSLDHLPCHQTARPASCSRTQYIAGIALEAFMPIAASSTHTGALITPRTTFDELPFAEQTPLYISRQ